MTINHIFALNFYMHDNTNLHTQIYISCTTQIIIFLIMFL